MSEYMDEQMSVDKCDPLFLLPFPLFFSETRLLEKKEINKHLFFNGGNLKDNECQQQQVLGDYQQQRQ